MIKENDEEDNEQSFFVASQQKWFVAGGASKELKPTVIDMKVVVTNHKTPLKKEAGVGVDERGRQVVSPEQLENMSIEQLCDEINKIVMSKSQSEENLMEVNTAPRTG